MVMKLRDCVSFCSVVRIVFKKNLELRWMVRFLCDFYLRRVTLQTNETWSTKLYFQSETLLSSVTCYLSSYQKYAKGPGFNITFDGLFRNNFYCQLRVWFVSLYFSPSFFFSCKTRKVCCRIQSRLGKEIAPSFLNV